MELMSTVLITIILIIHIIYICPSHSTTSYTAEDLDNIIISKGYNASNSKMYGTGQYFKEAEETYGQNALMMFSHAATESSYGTSNIAMDKNNLFGYGAADSCAYDCAYPYDSPRDSIMDYAQKTGDNYSYVTGKYYYGSHFGNKSSGRNVKYMTDPYAGEKEAAKSFLSDDDLVVVRILILIQLEYLKRDMLGVRYFTMRRIQNIYIL